MHTYCKLTDGRNMVVWSDNTDEETMHVFPVEDLAGFDAEHQNFTVVPYADVVRTDTSRTVAFA